MAYFKIEEPDKPVKWIKKVNGADGTLEFTDNINDAYYQDSGFFADSEKGFIEFHFMEKYPEIQYMTPEEQQKARRALLDYCCLDTFAMVKVWMKLCEVVS